MSNIFSELKRRNIFRVAGVYVVVGWITMQVISVMTPALNLPDSVDSIVAILLIAGFPIALIVAWAFELTADGMKRTEAVTDGESLRLETGRKLDIVIIGGLILVAGLVIWQTTRSSDVSTLVPAPKSEVQTIVGTSIAVLPFADMSAAGDQEYFSDGISEEILNALVKVPDLRVAGRTSSFSYKGKDIDMREIGTALNVEHILEGSVRKQGERVRITAQLITASDGIHMWSDTYDGTLEDIFDLQEQVSRAIAGELKVLLNVGEGERLAQTLTDNEEAYDAYLQARSLHYQQWGEGVLDRAIELAERAVALDPEFAEAWTLLGWATFDLTQYNTFADVQVYMDKSDRCFYRAQAIDPESLYAKLGLNTTLWESKEFLKATDQLHAYESKYGDFAGYKVAQASRAFALGQTRQVLPVFEEAVEADPFRPNLVNNLTATRLRLGDFEGAGEMADRTEQLGFAAIMFLKARLMAVNGDPDGAVAYFMQSYDSIGEQFASEIRSRDLWLLYANMTYKDDPDAKGALVNFVRDALEQPDNKVTNPFLVILIEAGEADFFFDNFNRNLFGGVSQTLAALWEPHSKGARIVRQHKDFPAFAERTGLLSIWQKYGWPDLCEPNSGTDGSDGKFTCD